MTNNGINLIKKWEGLRLKAYKPVPSENYYTIGYGHYGKDVTDNMVITKEQAEKMLLEDIATIEYQLKLFMPTTLQYKLNYNQWDAIVSFCFNLGVSAFHKSTLYKYIKANPNDIDHISKEWVKWCHSGGKVLNGLLNRRKEELDLYLTEPSYSYKCNYK